MKSAHHNTQNISNASASVDLTSKIVNPHFTTHGKSNMDNSSKMSATLQITPEEVTEKNHDYEKNLHIDLTNNNTTNNVMKQDKLNKHKIDVTTEKGQLNAENSVDALKSISETHDVYLNDLESNIIDEGSNSSMYFYQTLNICTKFLCNDFKMAFIF